MGEKSPSFDLVISNDLSLEKKFCALSFYFAISVTGTDPQRVQLALHQNASEGLRASSEELQDVSQVVAGDEVGPQFTVQEIDGQQIYITDISSAAAVHIADDVTGLDLQNAVLLTETDHGYEETEYEQFIID